MTIGAARARVAIIGAIIGGAIAAAHAQDVPRARFALIATNPYEVVATYSDVPSLLQLPGGAIVYRAAAGWSAYGYALVNVTPFTPSAGKEVTGSPSYSIDGSGNVTEAFATVPLPPPQQAEVLLAAGLALTSTSAPALNATYALDLKTQQKIIALVLYVTVNGAFPNGASALVVPDRSGALHRFTSAVTFLAFAKAVADYVDAVDETANVLAAGGTASWPVASATIP